MKNMYSLVKILMILVVKGNAQRWFRAKSRGIISSLGNHALSVTPSALLFLSSSSNTWRLKMPFNGDYQKAIMEEVVLITIYPQ